LASPDVKDAIFRQGSKAVSSSREAFGRYIKSEAEKFHAVIKAAGGWKDRSKRFGRHRLTSPARTNAANYAA